MSYEIPMISVWMGKNVDNMTNEEVRKYFKMAIKMLVDQSSWEDYRKATRAVYLESWRPAA